MSKGTITQHFWYCRKVLYLLFEGDYDISEFASNSQPAKRLALLGPYSRAPFYTKNKEYVDKTVNEPADYIVLDYQDLEHRLLVSGIDPVSYWNVRRITPDVYKRKDMIWVFKMYADFQDSIETQTHAEYALIKTSEIAITEYLSRKNQRIIQPSYTLLKPIGEHIDIYDKADENSNKVTLESIKVGTIHGHHLTMGLHGNELYWRVFNWTNESFFSGYILNKDVEMVAREHL